MSYDAEWNLLEHADNLNQLLKTLNSDFRDWEDTLNRPFFHLSMARNVIAFRCSSVIYPHLRFSPSHFQNSSSTFSIERVNRIPLWDFYASDLQRACIENNNHSRIIRDVSRSGRTPHVRSNLCSPQKVGLRFFWRVTKGKSQFSNSGLNLILTCYPC